jgi:hypothetical protein
LRLALSPIHRWACWAPSLPAARRERELDRVVEEAFGRRMRLVGL